MSISKIIKAVQKSLGLSIDGNPGPQTWTAIRAAIVGRKPAATEGLDPIIRDVQGKLGVFVDGNAGPVTWNAIHESIAGNTVGTKATATDAIPSGIAGKKADSRSEGNIETLHVCVRPYARSLVEKAAGREIIIKVISGMRTYAEQDALYAQGRTKPGDKVTNARAGHSNHNFGIAFDVGLFSGNADPEKAKKYVSSSPVYKAVGALGMELGLEWGGSWTSIVDEPHFQLRPDWARKMSEREMLAELRRRKERGQDYFR